MPGHEAALQLKPDGDGAPVLICLLGSFRLLKENLPVPLRSAGKGQALLTGLGLADYHRLPRETLLVTLWPDSDLGRAAHSLSSLVHALHQLLGDALAGAPPVVFKDGGYELNHGAGVEVDVARFDALAAEGERLARHGHAGAAAAFWCRAVELYRGDVSAGDDVRAIVERERLRARYLTLLALLGDRHFQAENYRGALEYAARLLRHDPCREDAYRMVMRCHLRLGERAQALRQYQLCARLLEREFGAVPEPATQALYHAARSDPGSV
jgi:DNA-binding SARP family transcriptional activator